MLLDMAYMAALSGAFRRAACPAALTALVALFSTIPARPQVFFPADAQPLPTASPKERLAYYSIYLERHPENASALEGLARAQSELGMYARAIATDRRALRLNPSNYAVEIHLASALSWNKEYAASVEIYESILREHPENREALEGLERVEEWQGRDHDALAVERRLLALDPRNEAYLGTAAQLEIALKDDSAATNTLAALIRQRPDDRPALLELAGLQSRQGRFSEALRSYDAVLALRFYDPDALYGEARIYYFLGDFRRAGPLAERAAAARPNDFDTAMLCARIERALHHRKRAEALAKRASSLAPANSEARSLESAILHDYRVRVQTTASYARELAYQNFSYYGVHYPGQGLVMEDLDSYGATVRTSFSFLRNSESYVLAAAMPVNTPFGVFKGAAMPAELLYGQSTRVSPRLTLRGGVGGVRYGPGAPYYGFETPTFRPIGYAGASIRLSPDLDIDLGASRAAITYTPIAVRFGAMETRLEADLHWRITPRANLDLSYYHNYDSSMISIQYNPMNNAFGLASGGVDHGNGGTATFTYRLIRFERFSLDAGYEGKAFGYAGGNTGTYMGFFNPSLYQSHLLTLRSQLSSWGPFSCDLAAATGFQQAASGAPVTGAFRYGPALTVRLSRTLSVTANYVHYDFAQSLGRIEGNAVGLETDWRF